MSGDGERSLLHRSVPSLRQAAGSRWARLANLCSADICEPLALERRHGRAMGEWASGARTRQDTQSGCWVASPRRRSLEPLAATARTPLFLCIQASAFRAKTRHVSFCFRVLISGQNPNLVCIAKASCLWKPGPDKKRFLFWVACVGFGFTR